MEKEVGRMGQKQKRTRQNLKRNRTRQKNKRGDKFYKNPKSLVAFVLNYGQRSVPWKTHAGWSFGTLSERAFGDMKKD